MNLLMVGGDIAVAQGRKSVFYEMLRVFSTHWRRIDIICPRAPGTAPRTVHGNVFVHPSPWHKALQTLWALRKGNELLSERRYELVVSHDYGLFLSSPAVWRLSRRHGVPYVSEIHHVEGHPRASTPREALYRALTKRYVRWVWRRAEGIRTVNGQEVPLLLRKLGVPDEKILVLPSLYLDFQVFAPARGEVQYDVLFVGRLVPNKGVTTLLDALARVRTTHPTIRAAILGEGPLRAAVERRVDELGLGEHTTMIDRVPTARDVAALYNRARMVVCASGSEGGPRVTVEAMACATPVVSTPVGMMRELIRDGENGLLFAWEAGELAEKIRVLLDDEQLCRRIGEAGRQAALRFPADVVIGQLAATYQEIARRGASQAPAAQGVR